MTLQAREDLGETLHFSTLFEAFYGCTCGFGNSMVRQSGLRKNLELGAVLLMLPVSVQSRERGTSARKNQHLEHGGDAKKGWRWPWLLHQAQLVLPGALGAPPG